MVPARLQNAIAAGLAGSKPGAEKLFEAIGSGKASARLLQERVVEVKLNRVETARLEGAGRRTAGRRGLPKVDDKLACGDERPPRELRESKGDTSRGREDLREENCAICHTLAGKGAKVGPQLDGIGIRGLDRLLEDVLDPNRNVDQAFRTTVLELKDGKQVIGLLLKEEGEVYVMADAQGKEVRVSKNTVDDKPLALPLVADAGELRGSDPGGGVQPPDGVLAVADGEGRAAKMRQGRQKGGEAASSRKSLTLPGACLQ